mmetsp:Transcript_10422/g.42406  ORF Transcript_10422/g.42406 Transcript_10422/m.42406 type:complete len:382 (-) Transcript_10422:962-2107(-)
MGDVRPGAQVGGCAVLQDVVAMAGVLLHHLEFVRRELAGLEQDVVGDADLADVVQRRGMQQQVQFVVRQAEPAADELGVMGHAQDVGAGLGVTELRCPRQPQHGLQLAHAQRGGGPAHLERQVGRVLQQAGAGPREREQVAGAGRELDAIDRLGQEVIGPAGQGAVAGVLVGVGRDHQHRQLVTARAGAQPLHQLDAIQARHPVVQHDQVGPLLPRPGEAGLGIVERHGLAARDAFEQCLEQRQVDGVVVDDLGHLGRHGSVSSMRLSTSTSRGTPARSCSTSWSSPSSRCSRHRVSMRSLASAIGSAPNMRRVDLSEWLTCSSATQSRRASASTSRCSSLGHCSMNTGAMMRLTIASTERRPASKSKRGVAASAPADARA